jgi:acetyl esterase/lipase
MSINKLRCTGSMRRRRALRAYRTSNITLVTLAIFTAFTHAAVPKKAMPSQSIRLWNGPAPGAKGDAAANVPTIDVYLPLQNPTHTGVLVCPGGGYRYLSLDNEGRRVAEWLTVHGIAAFVLHYRVQPYGYPAPLLDGERAMRVVRSRVVEFDLASNHIGVWGFSAGGHVSSTLMTVFDAGLPPGRRRDGVDVVSDRPDFGILAYAVISMMPAITHPGSHDILLGKHPPAALERQYSNELHVQVDSPPAVIFATSDDNKVPVANSVLFYEAYIARKIPVEMHLFEHGEHGLGLGTGLPRLEHWPDLVASWMAAHGWMSSTDALEVR